MDNENANPEDLYTKPEEVWMVQKALQAVPNAKFTIAAAFGNVHGVYAPGGGGRRARDASRSVRERRRLW